MPVLDTVTLLVLSKGRNTTSQDLTVADDQEGNAIILLPGDDRFYLWDHELAEPQTIELLFDE